MSANFSVMGGAKKNNKTKKQKKRKNKQKKLLGNQNKTKTNKGVFFGMSMVSLVFYY